MTRSNRQLTQVAVDKVRQYLTYGPENFRNLEAGNTSVALDTCPCECGRPPHVVISLFGKQIMRLFTSPTNNRVVAGVVVSTGDFYDSKGRPSRTTRERLNGLLDALGTAGFIPEGVRVFLREDGTCCVGKDDACKALDAGTTKVVMLAHPHDLVFS